MTRILKKSSDRVLGGVLGGIADYFGWDYTLVRLAYVILSFMSIGFPGIIVYLVLWFIMPD
ncbi:PspC domain-containing protein [Reichenbachiella agarivorans]|uniref:PspC domain-containing protein n=1 Tax=Reichenbachiella agarivorans TaxID=2979464 RepID=A0ABY6D0S6_9BACT|nr:PspC domain-containing protein [Reichenbachiella agarivorans]UXP34080.1 PspC domain-containing protein [Reichenbachiella agarivorans]